MSHDLFPMKKAASIFVLALLMLVNSCETELDVAPYKPITIVYGLINIRDTAQYVRINRGFSTDGDPYNIVQINESRLSS